MGRRSAGSIGSTGGAILAGDGFESPRGVTDRLFDTEPGVEAPRTGVPFEDAPLAVRMRPRTLDELVGQEHLLGEGSTLRTAVATGEPHSAILYGPPGSGKTTLARIIAAASRGAFGRGRRTGRGSGGDRAGARAPPRRPADDLLPRRDPSFQQGSAGRAAA